MDQYNQDEKPPMIISVDDECVHLITDGQNFTDPMQAFTFPFEIWDKVVEYIEMVRRGAQIPDRNGKVHEPFLINPDWSDMNINDLLKGLE